jgi:hypothetical protein
MFDVIPRRSMNDRWHLRQLKQTQRFNVFRHVVASPVFKDEASHVHPNTIALRRQSGKLLGRDLLGVVRAVPVPVSNLNLMFVARGNVRS